MEVTPENLCQLFLMIESNNQEQVMNASQQILAMNKALENFINATFEIASNPAFQASNSIRSMAASQFMRAIDKNIDQIDGNFYKVMLVNLVPQIARICGLNEYSLLSPLIEAQRLLVENFMMQPAKFDPQPLQILAQVFQSIYTQFDTSNMLKTELVLQCYSYFMYNLQHESYANLHDEACIFFYKTYLEPLLVFLVNKGNTISTQIHPRFLENVMKAVLVMYEPRPVPDIQTNPNLSQILDLTTQLLLNLGSSNNVKIQNCKEICCNILNTYIRKGKRASHPYNININNSLVLEQWETTQVQIADVVTQELSNCPDYDLFQDHKCAESIFSLAESLLELNGTQQPIHLGAAELILSRAEQLLDKIIIMVTNAATVRIQHFKNEDLLVIDALKPCIDFIQSICLVNIRIRDRLYEQAVASVQTLLSNQLNPNLIDDIDVQSQIFVGTIFIRRGLPNIQPSLKYQVCLCGLAQHMCLHPIVFEEISKLLIQVTIDDMAYKEFQYIDQSNFEQAILEAQSGSNMCVSHIVQQMCMLFLNDQDTGIFQYRMLSGILSRAVRSQYFPQEKIFDLLTKCLIIMLKTENNCQSGGMVTFTKVSLAQLEAQTSCEYLTRLLTTVEEFQCLPQLIQERGKDERQTVENAFNILHLCIDSVMRMTPIFESAVVDLCHRLLSVDFGLSGAVFGVLNLIYKKEFIQIQGVEPELFNPVINGLLSVPSIDIISDALVYFCFISQRHCEVIKMAGPENSSLLQLSIKLLQQPDILSISMSLLIVHKILDNYVKDYNQDVQPLLLTLEDTYINVFSNLNYLCTAVNITTNTPCDPETKRYCMFCNALAFFQYLALTTQLNLFSGSKFESFLRTPQGLICLSTMLFTSLWCVQDNSQASTALRFSLMIYTSVAARSLVLFQSQLGLVIWPTLVWVRWGIKCVRDYSLERPPPVAFDILLQLPIDSTMIQQIFGNISSIAIVFAQIQTQTDLPFWNRTEASIFNTFIKLVAGNYQEKTQLVQLLNIENGAQGLAFNITQLFSQADYNHVPQMYAPYMQKQVYDLQQITMPGINLQQIL